MKPSLRISAYTLDLRTNIKHQHKKSSFIIKSNAGIANSKAQSASQHMHKQVLHAL